MPTTSYLSVSVPTTAIGAVFQYLLERHVPDIRVEDDGHSGGKLVTVDAESAPILYELATAFVGQAGTPFATGVR